MHNSVLFTTFDPLRDAPELCGACGVLPPIFHYEFCSEDESEQALSMKGYCCEVCATRLLKALECEESLEWAQEEAALAADNLDTTEFQERLASLRSVLTRSNQG